MKKILYIPAMLMLSGVMLLAGACSGDSTDGPGPDTGTYVSGLEVADLTEDGTIFIKDIGDTKQVNVSVKPGNADDADKYYFRFISSDPSIFVVNDDNSLTATGQGNAMLTIKARNNTDISARIPVKVEGVLVSQIEISGGNEVVTLNAGGTFDFAAVTTVLPDNATTKKVVYTSSDESVATVSDLGLIRAIWEGTATIRVEATDGGGTYAESSVTVNVIRMESLVIHDDYKTINLEAPATFQLTKGQSTTARVRYQPNNVSTTVLKYTSSDPTIATVDEANGMITSIKTGTVTITVSSTDGSNLSDNCTVNVSLYNYTLLPRTTWSVVDTSPIATSTGATGSDRLGTPASVIDDESLASCIALVIPGKTDNGVPGPTSPDKMYFTIDLGQVTSFNYFTITHSNTQTSSFYRVDELHLSGSSDNTTFTSLQNNVTFSYSGTNPIRVRLADTYSCRYLKVEVEPYYNYYNYVLIRDFKLGMFTIVP